MRGAAVSEARRPSPGHHRARDLSLDGFRGAAILLMMLDHITMYVAGLGVGGLEPIRFTLGRLAMPMFFVLAGHLAGSVRWRHLGIGLIGVALPLYVWTIDSPNVLTWWAVGCLLLWACRFLRINPIILAVVALGWSANRWESFETGYDPVALFGLMALGACLARDWFRVGGYAPRWVAAMGRRPITWYVGHLLVIHTAYLLLGGSWS